METTVYIDALFLLNFFINYIIISSSGRLLRVPCKRWRKAGGAALSSLLYILFFALGTSGGLGVLAGVSAIVMGLLAAYAPVTIRLLLRLILAAFAVTVFLGGGIYAAFNVFALSNIPLWFLLLSAAAIVALVTILMKVTRKKAMDKKMFAEIKLRFGGKSCSFRALVDTGHSVFEPNSKKPVIVAEHGIISSILPKGFQDDVVLAAEAFEAAGLSDRFHLIPYRSIGQSGGVLVGFRPDSALADGVSKEVVIAVFMGKLSYENEYTALIGAELIGG